MAQRCHVCGFLPQDPQALRCANCAALHETEKSQKEPDSDYRYEPVAGVPFEMKGKNLLPDDDVKIKIKGDREVRGRVDLASNKCVLYLNREGKARVQFKPDEIEWIEITALADSVLPLESRIPLRSESPRINTWIEQGAQSAFPHRYDQRNSPSAVVEFKKGMEQEMIQLFEEPVGLDCPYLYRIEPDGVLIAETGEEEIVLWKTRAPETYLGFDPRKGIIEHLRAVTERAQTLAEYTAGGQEYSVFSYASPSSMRNPRTDTKPGGAKAVYGGFRFRIRGQDQDIRPKDKDAQIAARRVSRRGLARRIAAAKKWHQSAQGSRYHRALGRYNQGELKTSPKETLENRSLSNGLDLFFADMRLWALAPAINEARIADSSEILTQNTPVGAFPDGLSASPSRVVGGVEEQGAGKGAGGRESREPSQKKSESHNPSLDSFGPSPADSKNLPVHVSPAENLDYTRGQFIHVGDMVGETVGEAVEAGVFSTEDKGGEIRVRYKVRGKTFASTPIDKSVYPQYANQVRMELRRAAAGFFAKGEIPADLTQIYVEEGAGDVAESYGRDTWTFKFPSKEKAEAFAEAELGDGLRLTKANEYFQDWKVEFAYYVGKTGYLVLYGVNLSDQGWGLSISKKAKKYGGETWGYGLPMGEGASVYEGKTRLFVYKAVDGKWYLEVGDGKVETFGPYDKEMTPHVVALNHAPDWEYDELSRIPSDKSGKRPVPKGARFESLGEGEEGGLDTYWELFVPMVQGVPVAKEEDIRKAVEKYPLLADRYKLNMNHGWLNIGMYAPGEAGKAEKEIAKLLPVLKGVCGGRDFTVRKHQAWRSPTMPLTKFHEGLAGAKPGDRMKWTELNVGDHYALPNMSMVYKKVSPTAGALVNPDGTTRGKSVERNPSTTEVILLSLTTNHLRSGPGGAWQYEQRGYPYSAVVAEGAAPKAGDKFRLDWFTFKPGVEGKENAITFLDKGAVVVCLGSNLVPDTSMYGNPSYRFKVESNGEEHERLSVKTYSGEGYRPMSSVTIFLDPKALEKNWKPLKKGKRGESLGEDVVKGTCEVCGRRDLTGYMACNDKRLCPKCAAKVFGIPEKVIRDEWAKQGKTEGLGEANEETWAHLHQIVSRYEKEGKPHLAAAAVREVQAHVNPKASPKGRKAILSAKTFSEVHAALDLAKKEEDEALGEGVVKVGDFAKVIHQYNTALPGMVGQVQKIVKSNQTGAELANLFFGKNLGGQSLVVQVPLGSLEKSQGPIKAGPGESVEERYLTMTDLKVFGGKGVAEGQTLDKFVDMVKDQLRDKYGVEVGKPESKEDLHDQYKVVLPVGKSELWFRASEGDGSLAVDWIVDGKAKGTVRVNQPLCHLRTSAAIADEFDVWESVLSEEKFVCEPSTATKHGGKTLYKAGSRVESTHRPALFAFTEEAPGPQDTNFFYAASARWIGFIPLPGKEHADVNKETVDLIHHEHGGTPDGSMDYHGHKIEMFLLKKPLSDKGEWFKFVQKAGGLSSAQALDQADDARHKAAAAASQAEVERNLAGMSLGSPVSFFMGDLILGKGGKGWWLGRTSHEAIVFGKLDGSSKTLVYKTALHQVWPESRGGRPPSNLDAAFAKAKSLFRMEATEEGNVTERVQPLLTQEIRNKIPKLYSQEKVKDPIVYVKFFHAYGDGTWLATEFDGKDTFFGYTLMHGDGELGYFSLKELESLKGPMGVQRIERDMYFKPKPLSQAKHDAGLHEAAKGKPKFKPGDKVALVNYPSATATVEFVDRYDDFVGDWSYVVRTGGARVHWNEKGLRLAEAMNEDRDTDVNVVKRVKMFFARKGIKVNMRSAPGTNALIQVSMSKDPNVGFGGPLLSFPDMIRKAAVVASGGPKGQSEYGNVQPSIIAIRANEWDAFLKGMGESVGGRVGTLDLYEYLEEILKALPTGGKPPGEDEIARAAKKAKITPLLAKQIVNYYWGKGYAVQDIAFALGLVSKTVIDFVYPLIQKAGQPTGYMKGWGSESFVHRGDLKESEFNMSEIEGLHTRLDSMINTKQPIVAIVKTATDAAGIVKGWADNFSGEVKAGILRVAESFLTLADKAKITELYSDLKIVCDFISESIEILRRVLQKADIGVLGVVAARNQVPSLVAVGECSCGGPGTYYSMSDLKKSEAETKEEPEEGGSNGGQPGVKRTKTKEGIKVEINQVAMNILGLQ